VVILIVMKTAISLPDEIFEAAELLARKLGLSRSELYARAVREYVERQRRDDVTARLDAVYAHDDEGLDPVLARMQLGSLKREDW
jgi:metal-responsive CopG/Arc/MetJ family transcriptional regulator